MSSFLEDLLTETPSGAREVVRAKLRVAVTEGLLLAMEEANVTKAQLAELIGVTRSAVTQALSGTRNMSLNSLSDMAQALKLAVNVTFARPATASTVRQASQPSTARSIEAFIASNTPKKNVQRAGVGGSRFFEEVREMDGTKGEVAPTRSAAAVLVQYTDFTTYGSSPSVH